MSQRDCPSPEQLSSYVLGADGNDNSDRIEHHLADCAACQDTLHRLHAKSDTLISALQASGSAAQFESESQMQRALAAARNVRPAASARKLPAEKQKRSKTLKIRRIREYELLEKIGQGGMGSVYKARHMRLDRIVALKVLPPESTRNEQVVARFQNEMRAVGALDHENIVRATDAGEVKGIHFLVMELVEGMDLAKLSQQLGPLAIVDACELVRQAAVGLAHAHQNGLVHRDIKPSNLLLAVCSDRTGAVEEKEVDDEEERGPAEAGHDERGRYKPVVKILDLGLAQLRADREATELTSDGQIMGTPDYMAPEQGRDTRGVDIRADIYSLGCTLYKLLTGKAPFQGAQYKTAISKVVAHSKDPIPPIRSQRGDVPQRLANVLDRMLAKDAADRYATPSEVAAALKPFAAGSDLAALVTGKPSQAARQHGTDLDLASAMTGTTRAIEVSIAPPPVSMAARARRKSTSWPWIAAAAVPLMLILLGVVLLIRNNGDTVRVEINDPTLQVSIGGDSIEFIDNAWQGNKKPGRKKLAVKFGNELLTIGSPKVVSFADKTITHHLSIDVDGTKLASDSFEIVRGRTTVVKITYHKKVARAPTGSADSKIPEVRLEVVKTFDETDEGFIGNFPLAFWPGREQLIHTIAAGGTPHTLNIATAEVEITPLAKDAPQNVRCVACSRNGSLMVLGTSTGAVHVWDLEVGKSLAILKTAMPRVLEVAITADGDVVAHVAHATKPLSSASFLHRWQAKTWKEVVRLKMHSGGYTTDTAAFSPDGRTLAARTREGLVLYNVIAGRPIDKVRFDRQGHQRDVNGKHLGIYFIAYSPDGSRIVTWSPDGQAVVNDAQTGKIIHRLRHEGHASFLCRLHSRRADADHDHVSSLTQFFGRR